MARILGYGHQVGYSALVEKHCGIKLNKDLQYSKWLKRPLSEEMIKYAACDTIHLIKIFEELNSLLTEEDKFLAEKLTKQEILNGMKERSPMKSWLRFIAQFGNILEINQKKIAKEMIISREDIAKTKNKIPRFIISDFTIFTAAKNNQIHPELKK